MPRPLTDTEHPLVIRTDFSDPAAWDLIVAETRAPVGPDRFLAYVEFMSDRDYEGWTTAELLRSKGAYRHSFLFVADRISMTRPEHPLLVVDLQQESGRTFRAVPETVQGIENNLSIANMDFDEFADAAGAEPDETFRGFPA
jgi:hypothetical protein